MSITTFHLRSFSLISALLLPLAAWAASPTAFTYVERTGVNTNVTVSSEAKTVSGFEGTLPVSVSAGAGAQYRVGSGSFTSAAGSISAGQTLSIRHTSAVSANTATMTVVTVGDYSTHFKSVTGASDRTPDEFDFGTRLYTPPNTYVESASKVLAGYNASVSIVAGPGAQYRIDGGSWTNASGTLEPGQTLAMRHLTSAQPSAFTKTYLKVGGITGYFNTRNKGLGNELPEANAGADQTLDEGATVTLDGSASRDPDGYSVTYGWSQSAGPAVTLTGANTAKPSFTAPNVTGNQALRFQLTVTDADSASATDEVQITVTDHPPVANAGPDQSVDEGVSATLDGSASTGVTGYAWSQTAGPATSPKNTHARTLEANGSNRTSSEIKVGENQRTAQFVLVCPTSCGTTARTTSQK